MNWYYLYDMINHVNASAQWCEYLRTAIEIYEEDGTMAMQIYINDLLRGENITLAEASLMYEVLNRVV